MTACGNSLHRSQNDGCTFDNTNSVPMLGSDQVITPGGGHRRAQGLNFHHSYETAECPHELFNDRRVAPVLQGGGSLLN
jgi:hypothetical protein